MSKLIYRTESLRLYRCTDHGQMLGTFRLPVNALYGHDQEGDFVYMHPHRDYIISRSNFQAIKSRILSLSVLRYKGNPLYPTCKEWQETEVAPNSDLYTGILRYFGSIPSASDPRLWMKPHKAGKNPNANRNKGKVLHREAPAFRRPKPTTDNIFFGARQRHASIEAWNGNI